ncbi:3-methyladenine DNA glycosylase 2 [Pseudomonas alkylphenolica]|uniref:DNA-3-methyladenine glycosylase II n=1 Tax=Pseudomonas alkylphenolica TaxID=237609 RepID=A0A443ZK30_9PSED|nr:AlkA N-terminal domain-containing protein [Pseudomonas alkylphenolica]RWU19241.1 3-methyladenine DNA glycosylase 2 [Pseudomonas alkylphenolica]
MKAFSSLQGYRRTLRSAPTLTVWLRYRAPYHWPSMLGFLQARSIAAIEAVEAGEYRRTVVLGGHHGIIHCRPVAADQLAVTLYGLPPRVLPALVARLRRVFDLDAEPQRIERDLSRDTLMAGLIAARPGLRVPGGWAAFEQAMRTVLGQQISVAGAMTLAGRMVARHGVPLAPGLTGDERLTHVFPHPKAIASSDLSGLGMPRARASTLSVMAQAILDEPGLLRAGNDLHTWVKRLCLLPGIGPWSAQYLALRLRGDVDAFPLGDVALLKALRQLEPGDVKLAERSLAWRPWRAYAAQHLWASLSASQD